MYDPKEDLYGMGGDCPRDETERTCLGSRASLSLAPPFSVSRLEDDDRISFPVYENHERDGDESAEQSETMDDPSVAPSMILRPISHVSIERPEDDTAARMQPVRHVDYLSHEWSEEDLWSTWKHIVSGRNAYNNSARLENASWRIWEKTRLNLSTVSPGSVKWLKDHDVTWLYGPLQPGSSLDGSYRSDHSPRRSRRSNSIRQRQKPILKKRSLSELMLRKSLSSVSLKLAATAGEAYKHRAASTYNSFLSPTPALTPPSSYTSEVTTPNPNSWKNVRFHELVEQCVALANLEDDEYCSANSDDDVVVMRKVPKRTRKPSTPVECVPGTPPSKTIEKLPHAPLKSPSPTSGDELGASYFPTQQAAPLEASPLMFQDESEDDDEWKPPTWLRNRKDSVHLLHDKLNAIKRSIVVPPPSKPLHDSPRANPSLGKGDTVPVDALTTEGRTSSITFQLAAFSFTSETDTTTPVVSKSQEVACSAGVDPAFTAHDYFSPQLSNTDSYDDDEYDWIEGCALEQPVKLTLSPYDTTKPPFPFPALPRAITEDTLPPARTSSDSGYGPEYSPITSVRDTYNGVAETEKERALCDWDLYPGAWDAVELEEAVAWSNGF